MMDFKKIRNIHFIGIGGIGMSALARWFLSHKYKVGGSDISPSPLLKKLKDEGAKIYIGHSSKYVKPNIDSVVYSAAINRDNSELKKAQELKIAAEPYSRVVGKIIRNYKPLCVAGAHGKSTTSSLLALVLINADFDPTVLVGTKLNEFNGSNFRNGNGKYFVLESDEHNRAFLHYSPFGIIITNIDREHLDCYKNLSDIKNTFLKFIQNLQNKGILILNADNKNLFSLKNKISEIVKKKKALAIWYGFKNTRKTDANTRIINKIKEVIKIPGQHNISNVLGVYSLAKALGIEEEIILKTISEFNGSWRRMEYRGRLKVKGERLKAVVYDDYAHHPTEIKATLKGFKQKYPKRKLICVFQPHQARRLEILFKDFTRCFSAADFLVLLDIYKVAGRDFEIKDGLIGELASEIKKNSKLLKVVYPKNSINIRLELIKIVRKNPTSTIIMMGAGDIYKLTDNLVR